MHRWVLRCVSLCLAAVLLVGCNPTIYVRDGVTDGDTFYLAPQAFTSGDPAVASWVRFSLTRTACKLEVGRDATGGDRESRTPALRHSTHDSDNYY
jgi:hypothetical protein